jgi:murein DD-endopeptidase MepM/ murein hydrolase activator NlpD
MTGSSLDSRCAFPLVLLIAFAACGGEPERRGREGGGASGRSAGGNAGDAAGGGGTPAAAGAAGAAGGRPAAGAAGAAIAGQSGAGNTGGDPGSAGLSSAAGSNQGGTAGRAAGGASGSGVGGAGVGGIGGNGGTGGGPAGAGQGASNEGGASSEAGSAGEGGAGASGAANEPVGLSWPIACIPGENCVRIGYPDTDADGTAHDCSEPGYVGHHGTDIDISEAARAAGTAVRAAADGTVVFAFDGKFDQCPNSAEPDCQAPPGDEPGATTGTTVCTPIGPYCGTGQDGCFWCFAGGNVIVIRHSGVPGVFATRYDHLKKNSVRVRAGDTVTRGEKIAEAASAGNSTRPHLHFEVWGTGFYELADPWAGPCGPNTGPSLWAFDPPWSE